MRDNNYRKGTANADNKILNMRFLLYACSLQNVPIKLKMCAP